MAKRKLKVKATVDNVAKWQAWLQQYANPPTVDTIAADMVAAIERAVAQQFK